jgi:hypothetical protein
MYFRRNMSTRKTFDLDALHALRSNCRRTALVMFGSVCLAISAHAQSDHYAPLVLELPASAHAQALGDAYFTARDQDVLFYNPAQLVIARGMGVDVGRYGSTATIGSVSSITALGEGGVGIGVQWLGYDGPFRGPVAARELGVRGPVAASDLVATIAGAALFHDFRIGVGAKYLSEELGGGRGGAPAFDVGITHELGLRHQYLVSLAAQNIGPSLRVADVVTPLPRRISLGVGTTTIDEGPIDLRFVGSVSLLSDWSVAPAAGAEAEFMWLEGYSITARAGIKRADRLAGESSRGTGTVGAGLTVDRVSLDYAFADESGVPVHRIGLRLR